MMKGNLVACLQRFNRKERYWVLANALGGDITVMGEAFRQGLAANGINVPTSCWWAMDYHIDWLVGAMNLYVKPDDWVTSPEAVCEGKICGSQQDIDFLLAFDSTLVMVEAKAEVAWSVEQLKEKVKRLSSLFGENGQRISPLTLHYVLMSPRTPLSIAAMVRNHPPSDEWPRWLRNANGELNYLELHMGIGTLSGPDLMTTRWDKANGTPSKFGGDGKVIPVKCG